MGLIESGISKVRTTILPAGLLAAGRAAVLPGAVLVEWHSQWTDKLHQVYADGRYAAATVDCSQRSLAVSLPARRASAVQLQVFAVEPAEAHIDFGDELVAARRGAGCRVELRFARLQRLPASATAEVFGDGGPGVPGEINYEQPLTRRGLRVWPAWQDKGGFGLGKFGRGDFGFDGAAAVGFGKGAFGAGEFGFDADLLGWVSGELAAGSYRFAVRVTDAAGNVQASPTETEPVIVIPPAKPVRALEAISYRKDTNELVIEVL